MLFNSLPNNKILDQFKFKDETEKLKFVSEMVENSLAEGENAGYQHFHLFPKCFQKPPSSRSLKVGIVW